jgi:hypothetical protein
MAKARGIRTVIRESSGKVGCSGNDAREYTCERATEILKRKRVNWLFQDRNVIRLLGQSTPELLESWG